MAAVDPVPTYRHQVAKALVTNMSLFDEDTLIDDFVDRWLSATKPDWKDRRVRANMVLANPDWWRISSEDDDYWVRHEGKWPDALSSLCTRSPDDVYRNRFPSRACNRLMRLLIDEAKVKTIVTDSAARVWLVHKLITHSWTTAPLHKSWSESPPIMDMIWTHQLPDMKATAPAAQTAWQNIPLITRVCEREMRAAQFAQDLLLRCPAQVSKVTNLGARANVPTLEAFDIDGKSRVKDCEDVRVFRMPGLWYILDKRTLELAVLDKPGIEQVNTRVRRYANWKYIAMNYRRTNGLCAQTSKAHALFEVISKWMISGMARLGKAEEEPWVLASAMKTVLAAAVACYGIDEEPEFLQAELQAKATIMVHRAEQQWPGCRELWASVTAIGAPKEMVVDQLYLFHLIPSSDASLRELWTKTKDEMSKAHVSNPVAKARFLMYCKSWLLIYVLASTQDANLPVQCAKGYDPTNRPWWKTCLNGTAEMPPESEWGKCWLLGALQYEKSATWWWLSAADVTHVSARHCDWPRFVGSDELERANTNEILYVLKNGARLSWEWMPEEVRKQVVSGRKLYVTASDLSAKSENTKGGRKTREIHSGTDAWREMQSEFEQNVRRMSRFYPGPVVGMDSHTLSKMMHKFAATLTGRKNVIASSQDVASWSPHMDRSLLFDFSDILRDAFDHQGDCPRMRSMWDGSMVRVNKRGVTRADDVSTGAIMGFTGSTDTMLHAALLAYIVRRAKDKGILLHDEYAHPATLIDDAVLCIELSESVATASSRVMAITAHIRSVYEELGFEVDPVKSLTSTTRISFLNRVFGDAREWLTPSKIASKVDREYSIIPNSVFEQMDSCFNTAYSAAERGADPVAMYKLGMQYAVSSILSTSAANTKVGAHIGAFYARVPQDFGGWGIKSFMEWSGSGRPDQLSSWATEVAELQKTLSAAGDAVGLDSVARMTSLVVGQEMHADNMPATKAFANPLAIRISGVAQPHAAVSRMLLSAAKRYAADPTVCAFLHQIDSAELETVLNAILLQGTVSAPMLTAINDALPGEQLRAVLARVKKSDILFALTRWRDRLHLRKTIKELDAALTQHLVRLHTKLFQHAEPLYINCGYTLARNVREKYQQHLGYSITYTTTPAASEMLVQTTRKAGALSLVHVGLKTGGAGCDLYMGVPHGSGSHGIKSKGWKWDDFPAFRDAPPGAKNILKALAITIFEVGREGSKVVFKLLSHLWTGSYNTFDDIPVPTINLSTAKRLLRSSFVRNAPISFLPNTQGMVVVSCEGLVGWLSDRHSSHNTSTLIQEMRLCGLMDVLFGVQWKERKYIIDSSTVILWDEVACHMSMPDGLEDMIAAVRAGAATATPVCTSAIAALKSLQEFKLPNAPVIENTGSTLVAAYTPKEARNLMPARWLEDVGKRGARTDVVIGPLPPGALPRPVAMASVRADTADATVVTGGRSTERDIERLALGSTSRVNAATTVMCERITNAFGKFVPNHMSDPPTIESFWECVVREHPTFQSSLTAAKAISANIWYNFIRKRCEEVFAKWMEAEMGAGPGTAVCTAMSTKDMESTDLEVFIKRVYARHFGIYTWTTDNLHAIRLGGARNAWVSWINKLQVSARFTSWAANWMSSLLNTTTEDEWRDVATLATKFAGIVSEDLRSHGEEWRAIEDWGKVTRPVASSALHRYSHSFKNPAKFRAISICRDKIYLIRAIAGSQPSPAVPMPMTASYVAPPLPTRTLTQEDAAAAIDFLSGGTHITYGGQSALEGRPADEQVTAEELTRYLERVSLTLKPAGMSHEEFARRRGHSLEEVNEDPDQVKDIKAMLEGIKAKHNVDVR